MTDAERAKALEAGIRSYMSGHFKRKVGTPYRKDGIPSKHDKCIHGLSMYDECDGCVCEHFEKVLADAGLS